MSTFKIPKNNTRTDPEIVKRYDSASDTWVDCQFAKRYDTASKSWIEIWTAVKWMSQMNNTLKSGTIAGTISDTGHGKGWAIWYFNGGDNDGGSVTYYLDGNFVNPIISFDYDGWFGYTPGDTYTQTTVGRLDLYTRSTSGAEDYTSALSSIKVVDGTENYSTTLNGTFNRVGYKFTFQNWGSGTDAYSPQYLFNMYNLLIDGKECRPSEDCAMK